MKFHSQSAYSAQFTSCGAKDDYRAAGKTDGWQIPPDFTLTVLYNYSTNTLIY